MRTGFMLAGKQEVFGQTDDSCLPWNAEVSMVRLARIRNYYYTIQRYIYGIISTNIYCHKPKFARYKTKFCTAAMTLLTHKSMFQVKFICVYMVYFHIKFIFA